VAELSAGAVVVDRASGRILLLHDPLEDRWCFPKGHLDAGETIPEAAARELEEEAGLSRVDWGPELPAVHYRFYQPHRRANVLKTVLYLVAFTRQRRVRLESTFDDHQWASPRNALHQLRFDSDREALRSALKALTHRLHRRSKKERGKRLGRGVDRRRTSRSS